LIQYPSIWVQTLERHERKRKEREREREREREGLRKLRGKNMENQDLAKFIVISGDPHSNNLKTS
jgi:hypothetical protein